MLKALIIFVIVYVAIASEKLPRHWVALGGAAMLLITKVLTPMDAFHAVNWETLGLLSGMFVLVSILLEAGFFSWLAMTAIRAVKYHPALLFIVLVLMAGVLAMFMDSITVMMFLSALTVQLCRLLKIDPVPMVIAEVCAANTGGAATLVGDPPNVILGTVLGYNFSDFAAHTGPISAVACLILVAIFYLANRRILMAAHTNLSSEIAEQMEDFNKEPLKLDLTRVGLISFLVAVTLLVVHRPLSDALGISINAAEAALIPAGFALLFLSAKHRKTVLLRVDGENILFFAGLFVLVGGLEKAHVFDSLAALLTSAGSLNPSALVMALHWGPGLLSGVVDNVPLALAMSYILKDLSHVPNMPALALMVWSLALGVDIGGNLTPIGASANVVAYTFIERNHGPIGWKRWMIIAAPPTIIVMVLASSLVFLKGIVGWY